jgi:hypothetical protein
MEIHKHHRISDAYLSIADRVGLEQVAILNQQLIHVLFEKLLFCGGGDVPLRISSTRS